MKQYVYRYHDVEALDCFLSGNPELQEIRRKAISSLIQIYAPASESDLSTITSCLVHNIPDAVIVGASSVGEIADTENSINTVIIIFNFFSDTHVTPFCMSSRPGDEFNTGNSLGHAVVSVSDIKGILVLTTPHTLNASSLFDGLRAVADQYVIFGGGAAESSKSRSWILHHDKTLPCGVVAVVLSSKVLRVKAGIGSGWRPFGKKMEISDVQDLKLISIDSMPATGVLQKYIGIFNERFYSQFASIFSLMIERNNHMVSRIPIMNDQSGGIYFLGDIKKGDRFRLGIGDPKLIFSDCNRIIKKLTEFQPEGILIFACGIHRILLQDDAHLETKPFSMLSSCGGFYTSGEYFNQRDNRTFVMNASLLVIGLSESSVIDSDDLIHLEKNIAHSGVYKNINTINVANKHTQVIGNLLTFIRSITKELEAKNKELLNLSITDKLTQLNNRAELDRVLSSEIARATRYNTPFSVFLLDVDNFKKINDRYGHIQGDRVLIDIAEILRTNTRECDIVGRWGGEEFLIILPQISASCACVLAEKICRIISEHDFNLIGMQTVSIGVAGFENGTDMNSLLRNADSALYESKNTGKNRVTIFKDRSSTHENPAFVLLKWSSEYECGNELIDHQHKQLFDISNTLINATMNKSSDDEIFGYLEALIDLAAQHFSDEENILSQTQYPYTKEHKRKHHAIVENIYRLIDEYKNHKLSMEKVIDIIIHKAIKQHLIKSDSKFYPYLIEYHKNTQ